MKRGDLIRHLERHGCVLLREGANHTLYINLRTRSTTAVGRHKEIYNIMARQICRQADVPVIG